MLPFNHNVPEQAFQMPNFVIIGHPKNQNNHLKIQKKKLMYERSKLQSLKPKLQTV